MNNQFSRRKFLQESPLLVAALASVVRAGAAVEVFPDVQIADTGAVEVRVSAAKLRVAAGSGATVGSELRVIVGRPDAVRGVTVARAGATAGGGSRPGGAADQRWLSVPLDLAD